MGPVFQFVFYFLTFLILAFELHSSSQADIIYCARVHYMKGYMRKPFISCKYYNYRLLRMYASFFYSFFLYFSSFSLLPSFFNLSFSYIFNMLSSSSLRTGHCTSATLVLLGALSILTLPFAPRANKWSCEFNNTYLSPFCSIFSSGD